MKNANINVLGDPENLFAAAERDAKKPAFIVGARVDEVRMNVCDHALLTLSAAHPQNKQSGKSSIKVNWQVFDVLNKKVVYSTLTEGFYESNKGVPNGELVLIHEAFAAAAQNLTADEKFVGLLRRQAPSIANVRPLDAKPLELDRQPLSDRPIQTVIDQVRLGVVTLDTGVGHGSGFFISPTHVLTNHHVVSGRKFVKVRLITGREILGEVIRSHAERDVAIVQVEAGGYRPLPVRMKPVKITEDVFAIGSPISKRLSGTVSKGIVSKFTSNRYGLEDIQADVNVHGGNSGGALLDARGNVVGVIYAGVNTKTAPAGGLNFFIPIYDAFAKMNLKFKPKNNAPRS